MALELSMIGLIVQDMGKSLEFYRRLGLAIPEGGEGQTHVEVKMGSGLTFFLDFEPSRWGPGFVRRDDPGHMEASNGCHSILEFYLKTRAAVDAKYAELERIRSTSSTHCWRTFPRSAPRHAQQGYRSSLFRITMWMRLARLDGRFTRPLCPKKEIW